MKESALTFWLPLQKLSVSKWQSSILTHIFTKLSFLSQEKNGIFQVIRRITRENWRSFGFCAAGKKNVSNDPVLRTITLQYIEKTQQPVRQVAIPWSEVKKFSLTWLWLWGQDHQQSALSKMHLESFSKDRLDWKLECADIAGWPLGFSATSAHIGRHAINSVSLKAMGKHRNWL